MVRKLKAGNDFLMGSFILKCIMMAPHIKMAMPETAGTAIFSIQIDSTIRITNNIFSPPTKYSTVSDKP